MNHLYVFLTVACLALNVIRVSAQTDSTSTTEDISLEDLLNMQVTVATQQGSSIRETPGIITVVTEEEIRNSGARDFIDVMRLVPGIDFGLDVDNQIGISIRGNWANEGKVLLMMDGMALNETSFGSYFFSDHILVENIKKIEIIRGPGSSVYGGMAGLAVINIITKTGEDLNGGSVQVNYGHSDGRTLRSNLQLAAGKKWDNGFQFSVSGYLNRSKFSNKVLNDYGGNPINFGDSSNIRNYGLNLGLSYKGLNFRYLEDFYTHQRIEYLDSDGDIFTSRRYIQLDYEKKLNSKLSIRSKFLWQHNKPWSYTESEESVLDEFYNYNNNRYTGNLTASYQATDKINVMAGAEYFLDQSAYVTSDSGYVFYTGERKRSFTNISAFAQAIVKTKFADLTAGVRYNKHSAFNDALVPRIALTKAWEKAHIKLLYSKAFKAPVILNIDYNDSIKPENISVAELEAGVKLSPNLYLTTNVYDVRLIDPIVYYQLNDTVSGYLNFDRAGTRGVEAELRYKSKRGYATLAYSYYQNHKTDVTEYLIPDNDKQLLGFPSHKLTFNASIKLAKDLTINPSVIYYSQKFTWYYDAALDSLVIQTLDQIVLAHLYINYSNIGGVKGLSAGLGVYNLFDSRMWYANPYTVGVNFTPSPGREFLARLMYKF